MKNKIIILVIVLAFIFFDPFKIKDLGSIHYKTTNSIVVVGESNMDVQNKIATFDVGMSVSYDDKKQAVDEVNETINKIVEQVKSFGIPSDDIKTSSVSIYQMQDYYYDSEGIQKSRPGQWSVSNSVQVKLKDITKVDALTDMLFASGATNVYGPNFAVDESNESKEVLFKDALSDATTKAEILAKESGRRLGKVMNISMGNATQINPMYFSKVDGIGGGGSPELEQGTSNISVNMTVTFELLD